MTLLRRKKDRVLPGLSITLGFSVLYLSLIVLIPLAALALKSAELSPSEWWDTVSDPRVVASYRLSLLTAFFAALVNLVFGLLLAWVLVRYKFPGKRIVDGLIDLPFALPTAVAGIALTTIYAPKGWVGSLLEPLGIKVAYTPLGITLALIFIGIPFVVRTVQPVLQDMESDMEEAAVLLGSYRARTFFKVILPDLIPPLLTGFALAFARGIGEYGSVVFISGNMPMKTEIAPLLIITKLEQYEYSQAAAVAVVLLLISFVLLLFINILQRWSNRRLRSVKGG
ncbi:sulfate ABC transporter permease subunit CysT [Cohnella cholangitidis]|uniref:Sulfate transport system permease protein CysT n=1 Tax=Cohnella cholangitidis TaxID=2598458 RepID=A0A7G5BV93_9BACL|nr:sulfate ABC transporter permease subunit CysT [Cohnella cholangitidis]QMV40877.1 sulfate ABC transporter permease subunit CysT [Cohnella cholangitidis]